MSQQSLILRSQSGDSVDRATVYERAPSRRTLAFQHLDVVLAIAAQGAGQGGLAEGNAILNARCLRGESARREDRDAGLRVADDTDCIEGMRHAPAAGNPEDPVIRRLSAPLAATESAADRHTGICADALRLAIVTRLLGLQSETQPSDERTAKVNEDCAERQMRALQ